MMIEARPFSNSAIDRAGKLLGQPAPSPTATDEEWGEWEEAYNVLSHWRSLHAFPLSSTTSTLRKRALLIDSKGTGGTKAKAICFDPPKTLQPGQHDPYPNAGYSGVQGCL